jgi:hypothetical protein
MDITICEIVLIIIIIILLYKIYKSPKESFVVYAKNDNAGMIISDNDFRLFLNSFLSENAQFANSEEMIQFIPKNLIENSSKYDLTNIKDALPNAAKTLEKEFGIKIDLNDPNSFPIILEKLRSLQTQKEVGKFIKLVMMAMAAQEKKIFTTYKQSNNSIHKDKYKQSNNKVINSIHKDKYKQSNNKAIKHKR